MGVEDQIRDMLGDDSAEAFTTVARMAMTLYRAFIEEGAGEELAMTFTMKIVEMMINRGGE